MNNAQKPRPLQATPPSQPQEPDERTTRHLRLCAELADLAMQLARAAAARTLADWAEPEQPPPAAEPPLAQAAELPFTQSAEQPVTQLAEPLTDREPAPRADRQTAPRTDSARITIPKQTDPAILFTRLAGVVRDCIALESRLAAGPANASKTRTHYRHIDPRRPLLREALFAAAENHPDRDVMRYETNARLEERLAADPDQSIPACDILEEICDEFGLEIDWAHLPDEILFATSEITNENGDAPDPHATSPP